MWMAVHRSACHRAEMYKDRDRTTSLEVVYTHELWWQVCFGADGKEGWGTGKGTLWQALETLSSIGGKGGVQKRMKGNSQWIRKSASCRDVWTAWLSHSQLSFSRNQLLIAMTICCNVLELKTKLQNGLFWNQKHNEVICTCMCITQHVCKIYICIGKTYNTDSI